jgi:hypothetical protein
MEYWNDGERKKARGEKQGAGGKKVQKWGSAAVRKKKMTHSA